MKNTAFSKAMLSTACLGQRRSCKKYTVAFMGSITH